MRPKALLRTVALASLTLCIAALVAGCGVAPAPRIVWGAVSYTPDDGHANATLTGTITNVGSAALNYAGIVAYAYDSSGNWLATSQTVSIRGIQPSGFVIYPGQTHTYDLAFPKDKLNGVQTFRIVVASSLDPIKETRWQAIYSLIP